MFDFSTLFSVMLFVSAVAGILLTFSWLQNRSIGALGLWGSAYLVSTVAMAVLVANRATPAAWPAMIAHPLWIAAHGLMWTAARHFEGRRTPLVFIFGGAALWLAACFDADFRHSVAARIMLASALMGGYLLLTAWEIWRARDKELMSRWPAIVLLALHGALFVGRVPFVYLLPFPGGIQPQNPHWFPAGVFEMLFHVFCMSVLLVNMAKERAELHQRRNSLIDPLTGVANRRAFIDCGEALLRHAAAGGRPAVLLLFDLDRFKSINDNFGYQAGDLVLSRFCEVARSELRRGDLFGRFGGEEFACILTDTSLGDALALAERIRLAFGTTPVAVGGGDATVTVSVGAAMAAGARLDDLFAAADRALYRAKAKGRNCVEATRAPLKVVDAGMAPVPAMANSLSA
jgi:diguanylate cyclase (GGDEF)-like protein